MRGKAVRALVCVLILLSLPATLLAFAFGLPAQYGETFLAGLPDKRERLAATQGPRIVVIGGSGVAFALQSDLLEEELPGYSVVNFGLYAGLGTTVMLDLARPLLREGDIVLFSPEQSGQTLSTYFSAEAMWQAADGHPELLAALGREYRGPLAGQFPYFAASKARAVRDGTAPTGEGVYARSSFNAYGDIDYPGRERNIMPGGYDPNMTISLDPSLPSEEFFKRVNAFAAACEKQGVTFLYRLCPMNAAAVPEEELARLDLFTQVLQNRLDCAILGDPHQAIMAPEWFYDTNFHLNSAGAVVNTAALCADLKTLLGDATPVKIDLPAMPAAGMGRALSATLYAGNTQIREVVIPKEITFIPDGAFDGCAALERIVMENPDPSACSVGAGLLTGTDALVYVPMERLGAYRTNYFWAVHASRIVGDERLTADLPPSLPVEVEPGPAQSPAPSTTQAGAAILYSANGGTLKVGEGDSVSRPMDNAHLRVNTLQGAGYFQREGYVLTGWNTAPDGSGEHIGLGSRMERQESLTLYAQWAQAAPERDFLYEVQDNEVHILRYLGSGPLCVVPETIDGLPVRRIGAGAFRSVELDTLVLPAALRAVEEGAFEGCSIREMYLCDGLREIGDGSFVNGTGPATLHVNAMVSPVYSGSYFDTFSDKYDWLLSIREEKKIVLFSGSSGRYGYDTPAILAAFPAYRAANMGVYAYTNALPQLDLIRELMGEGDILLSAPEFDAVENQFCATNRLDPGFWAMMESNYDAAAELDLTAYSGVFDSFGAYQKVRGGMAGRNYGDSPAHYDDDGNYYAFPTYNVYGDLILPRPNGDRDELLRHNIADYTVDSFPMEYVESLNRVYERFLEKGVEVYFTYTPRNRHSLTEKSAPDARRALHEYLTEALCVPVISDIEDSLYSGIYFYLIDSHLSTEGAALRTQRVIEELRELLK